MGDRVTSEGHPLGVGEGVLQGKEDWPFVD